MKIRWKLLILLLTIALVPLIVGAVLHRLGTRRLGSHLASGRREILVDTAKAHLRRLVDDYGRILHRDREILELALNIQAREVERRLAAPPSPTPRLFFCEDYDGGVNLPEGMVLSDRHRRPGPDGKEARILVTYAEQVYFLPRGVKREDVADDIARLSTMPQVYRLLNGFSPEQMYWQYTALEVGFHSSYPGHGGYPAEYDPRTRQWYLEARESGKLTWVIMPEVSTRTVAPAVAMPVYRPDGSFAGVTAIDVPLDAPLRQLRPPPQWSAGVVTMVVFPGEAGTKYEGKLAILAQKSYRIRQQDWQVRFELASLTSDDPAGLEALRRDALAGNSGVTRMPYRDRDALWAHGAGGEDRAFPVVIVPYDEIVAQAVEAENYVLGKMAQGLQIAGIIMLAVVVVVAVVAFVSSRSVSKPLIELTQASARLAAGEFDTRVDIRTGDELQELGEIFNDMGPKLAEREQMKRSLALATEVQQHLLPQEPPELDGFDIAGASVYCDETGGDYYDFIELVELGPDRLGIAVGDVTGHGIGAALLMASARGVLRSHAGRYGGNLGSLFQALNTHLVRDTGDGRFITLFFGVLSAADRSLEWTSGGHDPALWLRRSSGDIEELPNTGIPLGVIDGADYGQGGPVVLKGGDIILIGTDGIWEAANAAGEMFGKQRLCEILSAWADKTATDIHAAVVAAVNDFRADVPQADDITLVVIKAL